MKITRNTTPFETRDVRRVICKVHAIMTKLEARPAPNWKHLRIALRGTTNTYVRGYAYYHGRGAYAWDVHLTLPAGIREQRLAWLVYHELMHTYGYKHKQYTDARDHELAAWFPEDRAIRLAADVKPKAKASVQEIRHQRVVVKLAAWQTKQKRAANAIKKLKSQLRYYEKAALRKGKRDAP